MSTFKKARRGLHLNLFGIAWLCTMVLFISGAAYGIKPQCKPDKWFKCNDGMCVTKHWRCDSKPECIDGSDEFGCNTEIETNEIAIWGENEREAKSFHGKAILYYSLRPLSIQISRRFRVFVKCLLCDSYILYQMQTTLSFI